MDVALCFSKKGRVVVLSPSADNPVIIEVFERPGTVAFAEDNSFFVACNAMLSIAQLSNEWVEEKRLHVGVPVISMSVRGGIVAAVVYSTSSIKVLLLSVEGGTVITAVSDSAPVWLAVQDCALHPHRAVLAACAYGTNCVILHVIGSSASSWRAIRVRHPLSVVCHKGSVFILSKQRNACVVLKLKDGKVQGHHEQLDVVAWGSADWKWLRASGKHLFVLGDAVLSMLPMCEC